MEVIIKSFGEVQGVHFSTPAKISGKNGSGKTTILNGVSWCLFGKDIEGQEMGERIYSEKTATFDDKIAEVEIVFADMLLRRQAKPQFTRQGTLKSRISTTLWIDEVEVNQSEFDKKIGKIIYDFGKNNKINADILCTNPLLFLNLDYKDKRIVLNEIVKDKVGVEFDLPAALTERKSVKSQLLANGKEQDLTKSKLADIVVSQVAEIPAELQEAENQYQLMKGNSNADQIAEINRRNNAKIEENSRQIQVLTGQLMQIANEKLAYELDLNKLQGERFTPAEPQAEIKIDESDLRRKQAEFEALTIYNEDKDFWAAKRHEYADSAAVIAAQKEYDRACNMTSSEVAVCPISGELCKTATDNAAAAFESRKKNAIETAKRSFLELIHSLNAENTARFYEKQRIYEAELQRINEVKAENYKIVAANSKLEAQNESAKVKFESEKSAKITKIEAKLAELATKKENLDKELADLKNTPLALERLPEENTIPSSLEIAHREYEKANRQVIEMGAIVGAQRVEKERLTELLSDLRKRALELQQKYNTVNDQITNYLKSVEVALSDYFTGAYKLKFKLFSQTLDGEVNDDVCEVYADGKKNFNEAMTVNVGLQILAGLQKFFGKKYPVLIDRCESVNHLQLDGIEDCVATEVTRNEFAIAEL